MNGLAMYAENQSQSSDALVTEHAPLVKRIVYHMMGRLPATVSVDDLIQAGLIGLLEASRNYDPSQGASFETYAGIRIRGAVLDEVRKNDWAPRSVYKKARTISEAVRKIENREGRDARDLEVAEELGVSIDEYNQMLQDASGQRLTSFDEVTGQDEAMIDTVAGNASEPFDGVQTSDFRKALAASIAGLPERERLVMALYYDEELNLREIGEVLGVTESRVSQIHSQAILRLRARMTDWVSDS
jgi:RNA polymerase sigma factor for flagellar operon FliA